MKFKFNRKTGMVEQEIPSQADAAARARKLVGLSPLDIQDLPLGSTVRVKLPPANSGGLVGRNWNPITQVYGSSLGTSGRCSCAVCRSRKAAWESRAYSDIPYTGIRAGELIGWRFWRLDECGAGLTFLRSAYMPHIWHPDKPMTGSLKEGYGVFSWKDERLATLECTKWTSPEDPRLVIGSIAHWGEVAEHEKGYRSERAEIKSIIALVRFDFPCRIFTKHPLLDGLRQVYGVGE